MNRHSESGVSLIEFSMTLIIVSLLGVTMLNAYDIWQTRETVITTSDRLQTVREAVNIYIGKNRKLPCVASLTAASDSPSFGVETDCTAAPTAGETFEAAGGGGLNVRIGAVPVRTLNLPDEYIADSYERRFLFAVTREMAESQLLYRLNTGGVFMRDSNNNPLTEPDGSVLYTIISTGDDGKGGYTAAEGGLYIACDTTATDGENCDLNDGVFADTSLSTSRPGAGYFDDQVAYELRDNIKLGAINRYIYDVFDCTDGGDGANMFGENCSTAEFDGSDLYINAPSETPDNGISLYNRTFISETDGKAVLRAVIPVTYENQSGSGGLWEQAVHAAIYVNNTLVSEGMLIDPAETILEPEGYTGIIIGNANITKGVAYTVDVYLYSFGNQTVNREGWAGTIKHTDHSGTAVIEILEIID